MPTIRRLKSGKVSTTTAFIGLGANLGAREATIRRAVTNLDQQPDKHVVRISSLRETDPVGHTEQPRFVNGAAMIATSASPRQLLDDLLDLERALGRDRSRGARFGPRTIDLDLLLYGDEVIDEPGLQVPHPRLHERRFVLEPLAELDAGLVVPGRGPVSVLLAGLE